MHKKFFTHYMRVIQGQLICKKLDREKQANKGLRTQIMESKVVDFQQTMDEVTLTREAAQLERRYEQALKWEKGQFEGLFPYDVVDRMNEWLWDLWKESQKFPFVSLKRKVVDTNLDIVREFIHNLEASELFDENDKPWLQLKAERVLCRLHQSKEYWDAQPLN